MQINWLSVKQNWKDGKLFVENINTKVRSLSAVHQWKDTDAVINWYKNIHNKRKCIFIQIDIEKLYPSLSKELSYKKHSIILQHLLKLATEKLM